MRICTNSYYNNISCYKLSIQLFANSLNAPWSCSKYGNTQNTLPGVGASIYCSSFSHYSYFNQHSLEVNLFRRNKSFVFQPQVAPLSSPELQHPRGWPLAQTYAKQQLLCTWHSVFPSYAKHPGIVKRASGPRVGQQSYSWKTLWKWV